MEPKAGDRIRFLKTLTQDATDETPPFIFCRRGDLGTIEGVDAGNRFGEYRVFWDNWQSASFHCERSDFEVVL